VWILFGSGGWEWTLPGGLMFGLIRLTALSAEVISGFGWFEHMVEASRWHLREIRYNIELQQKLY